MHLVTNEQNVELIFFSFLFHFESITNYFIQRKRVIVTSEWFSFAKIMFCILLFIFAPLFCTLKISSIFARKICHFHNKNDANLFSFSLWQIKTHKCKWVCTSALLLLRDISNAFHNMSIIITQRNIVKNVIQNEWTEKKNEKQKMFAIWNISNKIA